MAGSVDVVVVGGGIAGSTLATVLARGGLGVLLLERDRAFRDKVRGENLVPWGVAEVQRLGLDDVLLAAGGCYETRCVLYDEIFTPAEAEATAVPMDPLLPGVPGGMDVGHPQACEALLRAAEAAGATAVRGVADDPAPRHLHPRSAAPCRRWLEECATDPLLRIPRAAQMLGPMDLPAEGFDERNVARILTLSA